MRQVFLTSSIAALAVMFAATTAFAEETKVTITKKDCRRLVRHSASADVAYKPGVDVRGRKVTPADAGGRRPLKLPDVFEFNVDVDIRKYLGGPEDDAAAASAAVIAGDKATAAASSAETAATAAEAAATAAATISTTAAADAATAATTATTARAAADTRSAADSADAATLAADKATFAETAATAASSTASLASTAAGSDAAKAALATAATSADTAATSATTSASASKTSNTALIAANRKAQKLTGLNMNVGKVRYNIKTGALSFNGQSLTDPDQAALAEACRNILKGGK
jgi:hypothetical protein